MKALINYKEHCKLRIISSDDSRHKHEIVKLLIMMLSKNKHEDAGIYSEWPLSNGDITDVMIDFGDSLVFYEVQKEVSPGWLKGIEQRDLDLGIDTIVIPLKELSNYLPELIIQLRERII